MTLTEIIVLMQSLQQKPESSVLDAVDQARAYAMLSPAQKLEIGYRAHT